MKEEIQLQIEDVRLSFGGLSALAGVSTGIKKGEIFAIIGPNGAGKTSLLNCINRFYNPDKGKIIFEGQNILNMKPHKVASLGIARTFQNVELFKHMTVIDNIKLGHHVHLKSGFLSGGIYYGKTRREEIALRREIEENDYRFIGNRAHPEKHCPYTSFWSSEEGGIGTCLSHETKNPSPRRASDRHEFGGDRGYRPFYSGY